MDKAFLFNLLYKNSRRVCCHECGADVGGMDTPLRLLRTGCPACGSHSQHFDFDIFTTMQETLAPLLKLLGADNGFQH